MSDLAPVLAAMGTSTAPYVGAGNLASLPVRSSAGAAVNASDLTSHSTWVTSHQANTPAPSTSHVTAVLLVVTLTERDGHA